MGILSIGIDLGLRSMVVHSWLNVACGRGENELSTCGKVA
jgi:hypothetical protein